MEGVVAMEGGKGSGPPGEVAVGSSSTPKQSSSLRAARAAGGLLDPKDAAYTCLGNASGGSSAGNTTIGTSGEHAHTQGGR